MKKFKLLRDANGGFLIQEENGKKVPLREIYKKITKDHHYQETRRKPMRDKNENS